MGDPTACMGGSEGKKEDNKQQSKKKNLEWKREKESLSAK